jgi:hypothetical protein
MALHANGCRADEIKIHEIIMHDNILYSLRHALDSNRRPFDKNIFHSHEKLNRRKIEIEALKRKMRLLDARDSIEKAIPFEVLTRGEREAHPKTKENCRRVILVSESRVMHSSR